ncbi:MAG: glutathione S-transferase family protein [Xanthobacteraceae bacterium]|nr:glutathione S-transferase family protein [Xanthobacteraceae bacterium]MCW5675253.1 glutathione S-transferase family protein [Xanthobacteraceae bacterium]MCW5676707.1 glutathione S-transferase family protein [Xanthobacteraceae bacterium]
MLILRSSPPSPFGRKIKIAAALLNLSDRIKVEVTDTNDPSDTIRKQNPLGKIPALILEDGSVLFDSPVILEYLDSLAGGGKIIPRDGKPRWDTLRLHATADGIMDAALLQVYEKRFRPEEHWVAKWTDYQAEKITRALDVLEASPPSLPATPDIGHIALACALGYLDLRFEGKWRADYPKLVAWLDDFAVKVPSFEKTKAH